MADRPAGARTWLAVVGPGLLLAATGVGAGDLLTAALAGSALGLAVLWAALAGAVLKWFLNEGLARWQMATGTTLLEGWVKCLGAWIQWVFIAYLLAWSLFTGGALISACGVGASALWPLGADLGVSKIIWGIVHSVAGVLLVHAGGFRLFERFMAGCIAVMFVTVLATVFLCRPDWPAIALALATPRLAAEGLDWTLGVLGGVGGTVTLLSYGYWIREAGRSGRDGLRICRIDLAVGYGMTALFGMAMVIIGTRVRMTQGPAVALDLARALEEMAGPVGRWVFLAGFWAAVFSSLVGVWQGVPYLFADFLEVRRRSRAGRPGPGAAMGPAGRGEATGPAAPGEAIGPTTPNEAMGPAAPGEAAGPAAPGEAMGPAAPGVAMGPAAPNLRLRESAAYRIYLWAIAVIPLPLLWVPISKAQLIYAAGGALFMPLLALTLLIMNNSRTWIRREFANGWFVNLTLVLALLLFAFLGVGTIRENLSKLLGSG